MNHLLALLLPWFVVGPAPLFEGPKVLYPPPAQVKADFLKLLDRPKVPLDPQVHLVVHGDDKLATEHLSFATERKADKSIERVPTLLIRPDQPTQRLAAIIVLHGTGANKESMRLWLTRLAKEGFAAVAIDARYHGERTKVGFGTTAYNAAIVRAWKAKEKEPQEHPFYYDTCWDVWRTIDYLESRPDIDPGRIGLMGVSMGGIEAWLAGACDDRVKVSVPMIGVQSFRWSLDHHLWRPRAFTIYPAHEAVAKEMGEIMISHRVYRALCNKVAPGLLDEFDCPSMLRLFAGRPLMIISGEKDFLCPIEGARLAFEEAETAFKEAKATDRLRIMTAKVGHTIAAEQRHAAIDWFKTWLEP